MIQSGWREGAITKVSAGANPRCRINKDTEGKSEEVTEGPGRLLWRVGRALDFAGRPLRRGSAERRVHRAGWGGQGVPDLGGLGSKCPI